MADQEFVCTLTEASRRVAKEELGEDPVERLGQVDTFRKWIREQKHLISPTDTGFLLKFLRKGKFSQLRSREYLENYLKAKTRFPEWLNDIDLADPDILQFISTGYMLGLPNHDGNNRRIIVADAGKIDFDKKKLQKATMIRAMFGLSFYMNQDENDLVNGAVLFQDFTHFSTKHLTFWGLDTAKKTTKIWQECFPGRPKEFHYYNVGPVFEAMMKVVKPFMKKKFVDRMHMYGNNMEDVYKHMSMQYLPSDYLPDDYKGPHQGSSRDITDSLMETLKSPHIRERVLYETSSKWKYDFKLKPEEDIPAESFRKLSAD